MMIGAGVFLGVGNAIHIAGPGGVMLTFALNGLIALFTAMSYAELSSAIPRAGGAYNFARVGFGRGTSFVAGWMEWFASSVAGAMYALTFAIYVLLYVKKLGFLGWIGEGSGLAGAEKMVAVLVAGLFLYVDYRGASETGRVGAFFTLGQTVFLVLIGVAGIVVVLHDPERLKNFTPFYPLGVEKVLVTMGFTYVAFEGFEVIAQAGDEAIDPRRNLPKAMLYSVLIVTVIYVGVAFATMVSVKAGHQGVADPVWEWIGGYKERGFGEAVSRLMPLGGLLLTLAVIFASTSALNATIFSATRASYALGRDRMLPKFMALISRKRKTPWAALAATGGIIGIVILFLPTMDVASSASIMFLFLFFLVNLCAIKIRRNMGDEMTYGYMMPLFPLFPAVAIICQTVLAAWLHHVSVTAWIVGPAWVLAGIVVFHLYSKSHAITTEEEIQVLEEEGVAKGDGYDIMVSVANPANALELVRNTYKLSGAKQARVNLLHMVAVPEQVPLADAADYMMTGKEAIVEAMLYLAPLFAITTTVRYCRNIARGIVSAVREKKIDMLIMGWHGKPRGRTFTLGSTVDPIVERVPCDVVILKDCGNTVFRRVLVPLAGGPNGALSLELASIIAEGSDSRITALNVSAGKKAFDIDGFVEANADRLHVKREQVHTKVVASRHVVRAIIKEAAEYDLVVIGCARERLVYHMGRATIPERVARACSKPLMMVRASVGLRSWIRRWI